MPLPRNKVHKRLGKPAAKAICSPDATPLGDSYMGRMEGAEGWNAVISIICEGFKIPDLTTRHGLKKVHTEFDTIYARLDGAYEAYKHEEKITGGIVSVYARMCADDLLRDRLYRKGFLRRIFPLLRVPTARHLALRALCAITHSLNTEGRLEVARDYKFVLRSLEDFPDDPVGSELGVAVLSHAIQAVVGFTADTPPQLFKELDMVPILQTVVNSAKYPFASPYLLGHAHSLFAITPYNCAVACKEVPSAITFLVAGLRSTSLSFRCSSLHALLRLYDHGSEHHHIPIDTFDLTEKIQHLPGHQQFESSTVATTIMNLIVGLTEYKINNDLYQLGLVFAEISIRMPQIEFSFPASATVSKGTSTIWRVEPAKIWMTSLRTCAAAIREHGKESEQHLADILEIKYLFRLTANASEMGKALDLAEKGVERYPDCAFFYDVLCIRGYAQHEGDYAICLKWAKKGLKCPNTPRFLRLHLLHYAVTWAGFLGAVKMKNATTTEYAWTEGLAFLTSALEDSETYIKEAPPDAVYLKDMLSWNLLLRIAINGPEIGLDLGEFKDTIQKIKNTESIRSLIGAASERTGPYLLQDTVVRLYAESVAEWGTAIRRNDRVHMWESYRPKNVDEALAKWLEDLPVDDSSVYACRTLQSNPTVNSNAVALYRCSWCRNCSAVLRKCSMCDKSRYCDAFCQRAHWKEHKRHCRPQE